MKYLITYSDFETEEVKASDLLKAQIIAHKAAVKRLRTVKTVTEVEPDEQEN